MKRLKQGPTEQFKMRKCKLKNHKIQKRNSLGGGSIDKETTRPQRRGLGRERTTNNSRIRANRNYSNNNKRGIQDITPRNRIID
jgi:hypothetical protein